MTARWACLHDLNNYFKKSDLLKGLTLLELKLLRKNIGVLDNIGDGGQMSTIKVNNELLTQNKRNKLLIPGARYLIDNFLTIYEINNVVYGKDSTPWSIVVIANTTDTLDPRITIIGHEDWLVEYDSTLKTLSDGSKDKGTITFLRDSNFNSAFYDFKHKLFIRNGVLYYTFSEIINGKIVDSSDLHNTKHNTLEHGCDNNIFLGDTYNNILQPECKNNTFWKGCINSNLGWNSVNNEFNEAVRYTNGSIYNKNIASGDTTLSTTISKVIYKVNDADIVSFLDPITYSHQIVIL